MTAPASIAVRTVETPPSTDEGPRPEPAERAAAAERLRSVLEHHTADDAPVDECLPIVEDVADENGRALIVLPFDPRSVSRALLEELVALAAADGGFDTVLQVGEALAVVRGNGIDVHGPGLAGADGIADLAARLARETAVDRWIEACDDETLARIASDAPHRRVLDLAESNVTDAGLAALDGFDELWSLDLSGTRVGDAGAPAIGRLTALRELVLDGCAFTTDGVRHFASLHELATLSLADNPLDDSALATIGRLPNLGELQLAGTRISDAGLRALLDLEALEELGLAGTAVTDAGVATLRERFGELLIER